MKVNIQHSENDELEVIIKCKEVNEEVQKIIDFIEIQVQRISGTIDGETHLLNPMEIYYFEYVDGKVFAYTKELICKIMLSLDYVEKSFEQLGFFRCSKSMVVNINFIDKLQSIIGNRIVATLSNGEEIVVSRHYAKVFRACLREE